MNDTELNRITRRDRQRHARRHGMRVDGGSVRSVQASLAARLYLRREHDGSPAAVTILKGRTL